MRYTALSTAFELSGSDKHIHWGHQYGYIYDFVFNALCFQKGAPLRMLEIGVSRNTGSSMTIFPTLSIIEYYIGIDIEPPKDPIPDNAGFHLLNAYTHEAIDLLQDTYKDFDVILDDGSHEADDQLFVLEHYPILLTDTGLLMVEDISPTRTLQRKPKDAFVLDGRINTLNRDGGEYKFDEMIICRRKP